VTEADWLAATDPEAMLDQLADQISDRKLRLFAVASVRQVLYIARDARSRHAVEVAERFADGSATTQERAVAERHALEAVAALPAGGIRWFAAMAAKTTVAEKLSARAVSTQTRPSDPMYQEHNQPRKKRQADFIRDIAGNPFRFEALKPEWFIGIGERIPQLASAIYANRSWDRLPLLADALEDAGWTDAELLCHLRGPGPHVRGCWAVDLVLEKS
jgi:hypothetical protein